MQVAIQVIWWIGLLAALALTPVVLKQVTLLLRTLRAIHELGTYTRDAARGIVDNVAEAPGLAAAGPPAAELARAGRALAATAVSLASKLGAPSTGPAGAPNRSRGT